jgi:hypothetical protein
MWFSSLTLARLGLGFKGLHEYGELRRIVGGGGLPGGGGKCRGSVGQSSWRRLRQGQGRDGDSSMTSIGLAWQR